MTVIYHPSIPLLLGPVAVVNFLEVDLWFSFVGGPHVETQNCGVCAVDFVARGQGTWTGLGSDRGSCVLVMWLWAENLACFGFGFLVCVMKIAQVSYSSKIVVACDLIHLGNQLLGSEEKCNQ